MKIEEIKQLQIDYDGVGSKPPASHVIAITEKILKGLKKRSLPEPDLFPWYKGVTLNWRSLGKSLVIGIYNNPDYLLFYDTIKESGSVDNIYDIYLLVEEYNKS